MTGFKRGSGVLFKVGTFFKLQWLLLEQLKMIKFFFLHYLPDLTYR